MLATAKLSGDPHTDEEDLHATACAVYAVLLGATARRLAIDLLAVVDAAQAGRIAVAPVAAPACGDRAVAAVVAREAQGMDAGIGPVEFALLFLAGRRHQRVADERACVARASLRWRRACHGDVFVGRVGAVTATRTQVGNKRAARRNVVEGEFAIGV